MNTRAAPAAVAVLAAILSTAPGLGQAQPRLGVEPPQPQPCPAALPAGSTCLAGRDHLGAWVWLARPAQWNGQLIVFAHDGPDLAEPGRERGQQDLSRWAVWLQAGYGWAGSSYRQSGLELQAAADDTERARQAWVGEFGAPQRTLLHGHGWGAGIATHVAARYTTPDLHPKRIGSGRPPYDALLLSNGVLVGAGRAYDAWLDLRVVYQALCQNHPRPDEPAYPLWMGLPPANSGQAGLSRADLAQRVEACTGVSKSPGQRSAAQRRALQTLTDVARIPESALQTLLGEATWQFQDIVWRKLKGRNPFGNEGVRYRGSADDDTLNRQLPRYVADPSALAALAADTDPATRLDLPVLTLHAVRDPIAPVEHESEFRRLLADAGNAAHLLQLYTDDDAHDGTTDAQVLSAAAALSDWLDRRQAPLPADVASSCRQLAARWQPARDCRYLSGYQSAPLASRVSERQRETVPSLVTRPAAVVNPGQPAAVPAAAPTAPRPDRSNLPGWRVSAPASAPR
jgi:alpha-beta hydrolase superfamily lysophospholipase